MFAGELAKPTSICLGAFDVDETASCVGYLIVSRYVDAWHVMNVAVDARPPAAAASRRCCSSGCSSSTADDARRGYTLEVRVSNAVAIALYERLGFEARGVRRGYYTDNREDALIMWKDAVAGERARDPRARDVAATRPPRRSSRATARSARTSSRRRPTLHARLRRRRARGRVAAAPRARRARRPRGARRGGRDARRRRRASPSRRARG